MPTAGHVAIRGGLIRLAGYGAATVLGTASSLVLLRYLGVRDYGRFATVIAIVGLVTSLADFGVNTVGQRDYVTDVDPAGRRKLLSNMVGMRLVFTPAAAAIGVAFAVIAGYDRTMVEGVVIGGIGAVFALLSLTMLTPATGALRFGAVTGTGLVRDVVNTLGIVALVVVGADLLPFFVVPALAALAAYLVSLRFVTPDARRARFAWHEWKPIVRHALPLGLAVVISTLYLRALLIMTSLTTSPVSTGLYAMSDRVIQVVVVGASVVVSASFPIVAHAGDRDEGRLVNALQQLFDIVIFGAIFGVLVFVIAARPIVLLLGGPAYAGSARLLQIQCFALFGAFLSTVWLPALVAIRKQGALVLVNLAGLATIAVVGGTLIPAYGAKGTAVAATLGEAAIAATGLVCLVRARPRLRPRLGAAAKLVATGCLCGAIAFIPGIPPAVAAGLAASGFAAAAWVSGAIPRAPVDALLSRRRRQD
jgi:O-antigen/teichoic acid export membrane protein